MSDEQPPAEFQQVLDSWRPAAIRVSGRIDAWPTRALAALLGAPAPVTGEALPLLWHEVHLHDAPRPDDLAADGHPRAGLLPPLKERRRMFGGGKVEVLAPMLVGEEVTRDSRVVDVRLRHGRSGWLLLVTEEHDFRNDGRLLVRDRRDIVYRVPSDISGTAGGAPVVPPEDLPQGPAALELETDPRVLFMYSALTYNPHRIHYDRDFTRDVEGHPDLLVHGPLLATGCAEAARRLLGSLCVMEYRLVAPAYCGEPVRFHVREHDDGACEVSALQGRRVCARAQVTPAAHRSASSPGPGERHDG